MKIETLNNLIKRVRKKEYLSAREKKEFISQIHKNLVSGTKVICHQMNDDPYPVPSGTVGVVDDIDVIGQIHVNWENGSTLALILEVDDFEVIAK